MKTFRIYTRSDSLRPIAVKVGFCWPAFVIGPLWFLVNRMWLYFVLVLLFVVGGHFALARTDFAGALEALLYLITWLVIGLIANPLLASDLESNGYVLRATVRASSMSRATDKAAELADTEANRSAL